MKRLANFSHYRLLIIALGVMLLLTSCKQLGLFSNILTAEEIPSPVGFDPGMELPSKYLTCPAIPNAAPVIPPGPYDEELSDCALRGKSTEIETWLTALEGIANSCLANRETNWAATLDSRDYLDAKIDEFKVIEVVKTVMPGSDQGYGITELQLVSICPLYIVTENIDPLRPLPELSQIYSIWLKNIGEDVEKYCTRIDEIIKPIWQACDEINFYQDCQAPNPEQYHAIVDRSMNSSQAKYDFTNFFFTNYLQNGGWDDFRSSFNEASLDCPPIQAFPSPPTFTFYMNTFCRRGPSSKYEEVATFLEGQKVQIQGRNHHEPRWWVIPNPGARGQCWVSDSTGAAEGPLEELEIVAPPPLVINKPNNDQSTTNTCSKDLRPSDCVAAGGNMAGGSTGASYCDCP